MFNLHRSPIWFDVIYSTPSFFAHSVDWTRHLLGAQFPMPASFNPYFLWPDMATVPPTAGTDCVGEDLWGRVIGAGAYPENRTALTETNRLQPPTDGRVHVNWGMIGVFYVFTAMYLTFKEAKSFVSQSTFSSKYSGAAEMMAHSPFSQSMRIRMVLVPSCTVPPMDGAILWHPTMTASQRLQGHVDGEHTDLSWIWCRSKCGK